MVELYKPLYTVREAAQMLLVNPDTIYALVRNGKLKALRLGSMKIRGTDLESFIENHVTVPVEA